MQCLRCTSYILPLCTSLFWLQEKATAQANREHYEINLPSIIFFDSASESLNIREQLPINTMVSMLSVEDPNRELSCATDSDLISLQPIHTELASLFFKIRTNRILDREVLDTFNLRIICSDNGSPSLSSSMYITVNVLDINDNSPIFPRDTYTFGIFEDINPGSIVSVVGAVDHDDAENGRIVYLLEPDAVSTIFTVDSNSGEITTKVRLDRELQDKYLFRVVAKDHGMPQRTGIATVQINIKDVNDNAPQFERSNFEFYISGEIESGTKVAQLVAYDLDLNRAPLVYYLNNITQIEGDRLLPFPFDVISNGTIVTSHSINNDEPLEFSFTVIVRDTGLYIIHSSSTSVTIKYSPGES